MPTCIDFQAPSFIYWSLQRRRRPSVACVSEPVLVWPACLPGLLATCLGILIYISIQQQPAPGGEYVVSGSQAVRTCGSYIFVGIACLLVLLIPCLGHGNFSPHHHRRLPAYLFTCKKKLYQSRAAP